MSYSAQFATYRQFYPKLLQVLPMDDAIFLGNLYSKNLLPGDIKDKISAKQTRADKAECFLHNVIYPGFHVNETSNNQLNKLLEVMTECDNDTVRLLAAQITANVPTLMGVSDESQCPSMTATANSLKDQYLSPFSKLTSVLGCVQLALIQKEAVQVHSNLDDFTRNTLKRERDVISHKKEKLNDKKDIFYYKNEACPSIIIIEGGPGVGKSTLVLKICQEWAAGNLLQEFKLVLLVQLREYRNVCLEDAIRLLLGVNAYQELQNVEGASAMLILDGYDEIGKSKQTDPFLANLLGGCLLPKLTLVIVGRSNACAHLNGIQRRIEVLGFSIEQIQGFIQKLMSKQSAKEFLSNLENSPLISSLFHIPVCLTMMVNVLNFSQILPWNLTHTELLKMFVVSTFIQHKEELRNSESMTTNDNTIHQIITQVFPSIPKDAISKILLLSRLAYEAFFESYTTNSSDYEPKMIFTANELVECGVLMSDSLDGSGFFQTTSLHLLPRNAISYNFIHLTVQEFFCAIHITLLPNKVQCKLIREHFAHFPHMFCFYFGVSDPLCSEVFDFICSKLTESLTKSDGTVTKCAMKCISESQLKEATSEPFIINLSYQTLLMYDCVSIAYLLSHFPVAQLRLLACGVGDKETELLVKQAVIYSSTNLQILDLRWNAITSDGIGHIIKIMNANTKTLKTINLAHNAIGDRGIMLLMEKFQWSDAVITNLVIWQCGFSVEGAESIAKVLEKNKTLKTLEIQGNHIGNKGMIMISKAVQKSNLRQLHVDHCGFSCEGAEALAEMIIFNSNIDSVNLWGNPITLEGARLLASLIRINRKLKFDEEYQEDPIVKGFMQNATIPTYNDVLYS